MFSQELAMDLGSSAFRIYINGKGMLVNEPSFAAVDSDGKIIASGRDAYNMIGRTSKKISIESPFSKGLVSNYPLAEYMMVASVKKVTAGKLILPGAVVAVPSDITELERRAISDIIEEAGVRKIDFVDSVTAAAIGAGLDIFGRTGTMIIDIGELKTDVAVFAAGETVAERSINIGGRDFTKALISYIKKKYQLETGYLSVENLKCEIGCAVPMDRSLTGRIAGKNYISGRIGAAVMNSDESLEAFSSILRTLGNEISEIMEDVPVAITGDVAIAGASLTGGGSLLSRMDSFLSSKLGFTVRPCENPRETVTLGTASAMRVISRNSEN